MKGIRTQIPSLLAIKATGEQCKIFLFPAHLGFFTLPKQCSHLLPAQKARDQICASGIIVQSANYRTTVKHLL